MFSPLKKNGWPVMKDLLVILASSSSFPHPTNRCHHHSTPFPKSKPSKKITPCPNPNPPLLLTVRWDPSTASLRDSPVNYYADLASKLAASGRFRHFLLVAESVVASGVEPSWFAGLLSNELVSAGVARLVCREGEVWSFVEVLRGLDKLGFGAIKVLDGVSQETLAKEVARECRRVLERGGGVEEAVELMEALSGFHFPIRDLVEPSEIVGLCVRKRDADLAVRSFPTLCLKT